MSAFDADVDVEVRAEFGAGPLDSGLTYPDDLSSRVRAASLTRGRHSFQEPFPAGFGTLTLDNSDGQLYTFDTGSPFSPNVKVGVPIMIQATHNAVPYDQGRWFAANWASAFPTNREELIRVPIVETIGRLIRKTIRFSSSAERSDVRVDAILDEAGWPAAARNLDVGVADVATLTDVESMAGFRLNETVIAEQGSLFQAANGDIRFLNRVAYGGITPAATFGPDDPDLTYVDVTYEDNEDLLYNQAHVSAETGDQAIVIDATSVSEHGPVSYPPIDSIDIKNQAEALSVATWIVARHANLTTRITGLVIDPAGDPVNLWPEVLGRELRDAITAKIKYPGASITFDQMVSVERIKHSFVAGDVWTTEYALHPLTDAEQGPFFQLDVSALDSDAALA